MATTELISISAAEWYPISAYYPYDEYITLKPALLQFKDGYKVFHHPLFDYTKDIAFNKESLFCLTSAMPFFTFADETIYAYAYLGSYATFQKFNGFIAATTTDNRLYLSAVEESNLTYFRIINNDNGTISILNGASLYVTVCSVLPYDLYLTSLEDVGEQDVQQFNVYSPDNNQIYITTKFINPYYPGFEPEYIERFWSFVPSTSAMRANGIIADDDYSYENPYLFTVAGYDVVYAVSGLTRDQTWIIYYNSISDKRFNLNVEIDNAVSGVPLHRLVDNPYKTQLKTDGIINVGSMAINIANLKTTMTSEYEYDFKS